MESQESYGCFSRSSDARGRSGFRGLSDSTSLGLDTYCVCLGNWCLLFYYSCRWEEMGGQERGRKRREWRGASQLASELRHSCHTGEMAPPHPRFPQGLSKVLSKTLDSSCPGENLELLHSKFLLCLKAKLPPPSGKCTGTCVKSSAFQNAWGQGQEFTASGSSFPTAAPLVESGFLEEEVGD